MLSYAYNYEDSCLFLALSCHKSKDFLLKNRKNIIAKDHREWRDFLDL